MPIVPAVGGPRSEKMSPQNRLFTHCARNAKYSPPSLPDSEHADIIMDISRKLTEQVNINNLNASSNVEILLGDDE